jgi:hypothetical protein
MKTTLIALAAAATVLLLTTALAARAEGDAGDAPRHHPPRPPLKEMDTNGDGKITYEEFRTAAEKRIQERFQKLDRNGDGVLSKDDRPRHRPERGADEE